MSLFAATLLTGLLLLTLGGLLLWNGTPVAAMAKAMPRSQRATYFFFGLGSAWFLFNVTQLGEADFGEYRTGLFIGFAVLALLCLRYVPDFLAVRGLAILILLSANVLLDSAFMLYDRPGRLVLVSLTYFAIFIALFLAAVPYRLRDFFHWLFARDPRPRVLGGTLAGAGLLLTVAAFTY